jgi:hypothetical protein
MLKSAKKPKKADDYHARHPEWVVEFNELTHGECAGGAGGVQWAAVRAWQQKHWQVNGLLTDGLIGPKTLEAARIVAKKSGEKPKDKGDANGEGAEKQHAGEEEKPKSETAAAEASADKPNLDEESTDSGATGKDDDAKETPDKGVRSKKPATVEQFQEALAKIDQLLAKFKPPTEANQAKPKQEEAAAKEKQAGGSGDMLAGKPLEGYGKVAQEILSTWDTTSSREKCDALLAALNSALEAEKVFHADGAKAAAKAPLRSDSAQGTLAKSQMNDAITHRPEHEAIEHLAPQVEAHAQSARRLS